MLRGLSIAAQALVGGRLPSSGTVGQFYPPTVLVGVTHDMRIWQEEVFGPVAVIVAAADDEDLVALANDCPFGLGSAVWCRDARRAKAISRRIEVQCHIRLNNLKVQSCFFTVHASTDHAIPLMHSCSTSVADLSQLPANEVLCSAPAGWHDEHQ